MDTQNNERRKNIFQLQSVMSDNNWLRRREKNKESSISQSELAVQHYVILFIILLWINAYSSLT